MSIWRRRPLDGVILVFLAYFIFGWLSNDIPVMLGFEHELAKQYAETIDPLQGNPTPSARFVLILAATVYGPAYPAMFYGIWKERDWAPRLVLPIAGMVLGTTLTYMYVSIAGDLPPLNLPVFLLLNGAFAVGCLLMIFHYARGPLQ